MILCTAGHVDHGKSALVEALTGRRMDRLSEERTRGITIDLNFAPLALADGTLAGVVDVPGHEDFVRTMVAGAGGVDCALLVVAADDGIKPQTREHAAIISALHVPAGIVAVTKADLVGADRLAALGAELDRWLAISPVQWAASIPVSAQDGRGLDALRAAIEQAARAAPPRDVHDAFRMPVDRSFAMAGAGTVVTGSVWSGAIEVGASVRLLPAGLEARVRTLEVHGARRERVEAGSRAAIGLAGIGCSSVGRGSEVVDPSLPWEPTSVLDVDLKFTEGAPTPIAARTRLQFLIGTSAVGARLVAATRLAQGEQSPARVLLDRPVVARGGDRFVLRLPAPVGTIGGGRILDPQPPRRRAPWPAQGRESGSLAGLRVLMARGGGGSATPPLALRAGLPVAEVDRLLAADGAVRRVAGAWMLGSVVDGAMAEVMATLERYHAEHPERGGMPHAELMAAAHRRVEVAASAVGDLVAHGRILVESGVARLPGHRARPAGGEAGAERVLQAVIDAGLTPPELPELRRRFPGVDVPAALRRGVETGRVHMVRSDWPYGSQALGEFADVMRSFGRGEVSVPALRGRTGLSRRYLIPLLEWADRSGLSRRVGDVRLLT